MKHDRRGFTIHELVITLSIASILVSLVAQNSAGARQAYAVGSARTMLSTLGARARAHAIERGRDTHFHVDIVGDQASIILDGDTLETVRFAESLGVALEASAASLDLYFTPRGYADPDLNSFSGSVTVDFVAGDARRALMIYPLGQMIAQ